MTCKRKVNHPGLVIKDAIDELNLNQSEFALRSGLSIKNVSTLISGDSNITFDVAVKLSYFFGNSVELWINLQTQFDLFMTEFQRAYDYENDWKVLKLIDKSFIEDYLGIQIDTKHKVNTINEIRKTFNVGYLTALKQPDIYAFYKTSVNKDIDENTIILRNAWISLAENKAREMTCKEFSKEKLLSSIPFIRSLTKLDQTVAFPKLKETLANCGIKLVFLPYLKGSNVSGVTKWIANENCILIAINDCGKYADKIWFAIFHELGHAIKNHKRHLTISYEKNKILDQEEIDANAFASESLINERHYKDFVERRDFSLKSISSFAKSEEIADFIVIGRLQNDKLIPWSQYNDCKIKYSNI